MEPNASQGPNPMAATNSTLPVVANRRRRVRHKIQTPAYATFTAESQGAMLDLHEIVNISEDGMAIQCHSPLEPQRTLSLCLDLADCPEHIYTTGQVIWSDGSGRAGVRFSALQPESMARLREWLFVNVMAGVANGEAEIAAFNGARSSGPPRPGHTDTLAAVAAVQRQVEALGSDLASALGLVAQRAQVLLRSSGAAIALAGGNPDSMICRASSGNDAPPVGARLHVGSGFSGECVKTGRLLRCDDTEVDPRVDRDSCRALGIRSILAAPARVGEKSIGLIEVFAPQAQAFSEADARVLQRFAETIVSAVNRAARAENLPQIGEPPTASFKPTGSVLFAAADQQERQEPTAEEKVPHGITFPRSLLMILVFAAATISAVLGIALAPWIQSEAAPWIRHKLHGRDHMELATVLAAPPKSNALSVDTASLDQLRDMAENGDPAAQNALGLRYATGDGVRLNEAEAVHWFIKSAEQGYVPAQSKLGSIYYSGRGVAPDPNRAYFWMVVARLSGDDASKTLAPFVRARLTRGQVTAIEFDADRWLQQHRPPNTKPPAGQLKAKF
jgi:TPR repeat protein